VTGIKNVGVNIWEKVWLEKYPEPIRRRMIGREQVRVEKQAVEGNDPHIGHRYVCGRLDQAIFEPDLLPYKYPNHLNPGYSSYLFVYEDGTDGVPKCWRINFRCRRITQKKH
jgi:hypothetical protein